MSKTTVFQARLRDFDPVDSGGLNLTVRAGRIRDDNTVTDKSDQVVALTDNNTNFVELTSVGVASANTSAFTSGSTPIAQVVTSGADITSVTDKRAWVVGGLSGGGSTPESDRVKRTAGDVTTTSTSLVDLTGASITFTTGANPVLLAFTCGSNNNTLNKDVFYNLDIDGSLEFGSAGVFYSQTPVGAQKIVSLMSLSATLTAASHTYKVRWKVSGGTGTTRGTSARAYIFSAVEIA